jgi:hypothetical protein
MLHKETVDPVLLKLIQKLFSISMDYTDPKMKWELIKKRILDMVHDPEQLFPQLKSWQKHELLRTPYRCY